MTLKEYLNQKEPERMPFVILKRSDYHIGSTIILADKTTITQVFIDGIEFNYLLKGKMNEYVSPTLRTTDAHGNPKALSCFHITQTECDKLRMFIQVHY